MEGVLTTKTEEKRKSRFPSPVLPKVDPPLESESGPQAGLPLFLQSFPIDGGMRAPAKPAPGKPEDVDQHEADWNSEASANSSRKQIALDSGRLQGLRSPHHSGPIPVAQTAEAAVSIQRDGVSALPPVPNFQLTPPSLLQPRTPTLLPPSEYQFRLSPEVTAMMRAQATEQVFRILNAERIRAALAQINPIAGAAGVGPPAPQTAPPGTPATTPSATPATTPAGPAPTPPLVVPGSRELGPGVIWAMITADPAINQLVTNAQSSALSALGDLSTPEKIGLISVTATMVLGPISVLSSDPRYRGVMLDQALGLINGSVLPIRARP